MTNRVVQVSDDTSLEFRLINQSGIAPTEFKVLVLPDIVAEKSAGGVIYPDGHKDTKQFAEIMGVLIAVSPLAFTYADWPPDAARPKPGDRVLFAMYGGRELPGKDGKKYRVINDKDVIAVLT